MPTIDEGDLNSNKRAEMGSRRISSNKEDPPPAEFEKKDKPLFETDESILLSDEKLLPETAGSSNVIKYSLPNSSFHVDSGDCMELTESSLLTDEKLSPSVFDDASVGNSSPSFTIKNALPSEKLADSVGRNCRIESRALPVTVATSSHDVASDLAPQTLHHRFEQKPRLQCSLAKLPLSCKYQAKPLQTRLPEFAMPRHHRKTRSALSSRPCHTMKPYANQVVKVTKHEIVKEMPENASSVFHVMDRRVNLDTHSSQSSVYALLRSWVQDDPYRYRKSPPHDVDFLKDDRRQVQDIRYDDVRSGKKTIKRSKPECCDIISVFGTHSASTPSIDSLRNDVIRRARKARKQQRKAYSTRIAAAKASLKRRGILPSHIERLRVDP